MIHIVSADERHAVNKGWLKSFWLLSFADYYDPNNIQFGPLRVFNDDVVMPGMGFPAHPHEEMELVTIVLQGEISHKDVLGNQYVIKPGAVLRMTAGTGIIHTELNMTNKPVHYYQLWLYPDKHNMKPSYSHESFKSESWHNMLLPIASGQRLPLSNLVKLNTNCTIYRCALDAGRAINLPASEDRRYFLYQTSGTLVINRTRIHNKDQARIDMEKNLLFQAEQKCEFMLVDLPSPMGWGYKEKILAGTKAFK